MHYYLEKALKFKYNENTAVLKGILYNLDRYMVEHSYIGKMQLSYVCTS